MDDIIASFLYFWPALVPAIFGIICHEVAHGWAAYRQGDPTAKMLGRLTLNPIKHIDPVGLGVFVVTALSPGSFVIGWAKPVPVQARYFRSPRQGMMLVSLAGPAANLLVALGCALLLKLIINLGLAGVIPSGEAAKIVLRGLLLGTSINCALACFNLMPIPPLDGSHILSGLLPRGLALHYAGLSRYGLLIVIVLLATGLLGKILLPLIGGCVYGLGTLTGVRALVQLGTAYM